MDMDLWWCPVCERAITEQEDTIQRPNLLKRATLPPAQPRYTSRGGVYGPKGSLYCSEACRQVEEFNGRFAFQQLAACLPQFVDRRSFHEEPETESTISSTDDATYRSRSLSLGRRSEGGANSNNNLNRTSASSPAGPNIVLNTNIKPNPHRLAPLTPQRLEAKNQDQPSPSQTSRRVPILLSPNGTPLIQPTFPQRPGLGTQQRRHHSHYSPLRLWASHTTTPTRTNPNVQQASHQPNGNSSNSVPTYVTDATILRRTNSNRTKSILNHQLIEKDDMEFEPEARLEKPTYLWQHYNLFYRSRSGHKRGDWVDTCNPTEMEHESVTSNHHNPIVNMSPQGSRASSQKSHHSTKLKTHRQSRGLGPSGNSQTLDENHKRIVPVRASSMMVTGKLVKKDPEGHSRHSKNRKTSILEDIKYSRSWSWDHLPADVPQYPAMDLEQIRLSKLSRERIEKQKLEEQEQQGSNNEIKKDASNNSDSIVRGRPSDPKVDHHKVLSDHHHNKNHYNHNQIHLKNVSASITSNILNGPIQTKKKLFVFQ